MRSLIFMLLLSIVIRPAMAQPFPPDKTLVEIQPEVLARQQMAIRKHEADLAEQVRQDEIAATEESARAIQRQEDHKRAVQQEQARADAIAQTIAAQQAEIADLKDRLSKAAPPKAAPAFGPTIPSKALSGSDATPN